MVWGEWYVIANTMADAIIKWRTRVQADFAEDIRSGDVYDPREPGGIPDAPEEPETVELLSDDVL